MQPTLIVKEMELHLWPELFQEVIDSSRREKSCEAMRVFGQTVATEQLCPSKT